MRRWGCNGKAYVVEGLSRRIASASDDGWFGCVELDIIVAIEIDGLIGEDGGTVVVADFAD